MTLPMGFQGSTIASVSSARNLVALPDGDLLVATSDSQIYIVPNAEAPGVTGSPKVFISLPENHAQSVAYGPDGNIYVGTTHGVYQIPYTDGAQSEPDSSATRIAQVRTGSVAPHSDGDVHVTSSVAVDSTSVYVSVGSSCNACTEVDGTRAVILQMNHDGSGVTTLATRIRNAIAMTINPATGTLWAGGAGQDSLPQGHPYEFMDAVTTHLPASPIDYGWPDCEENNVAYTTGANCTATVAPAVEFVAYSTHIGATFYPADQAGAYAFPSSYRGGLFVTNHGSWHSNPASPPAVNYVAMTGDVPAVSVNWSDPTAQWSEFLGGLGSMVSTSYNARATGIAVGPKGSLFVADDQNGAVYRIRPIP